ncbi:MAG: GNAT family N-acetyltransferase [Cyanobacteria bacterium P01_A01_bin.83]
MQIRLFQSQDESQVAELFHHTVRKINVQHYSPQQVKAWSPDNIYFRNWAEICSGRFTYVAVENDKIMGFGELKVDGHIDCFYVHHRYQRQGVGSNIYQAIEMKAKELNLTRLFTEASITAKPFFIRQGFVVIKQQQVFRRGEKFINFQMEKQLNY